MSTTDPRIIRAGPGLPALAHGEAIAASDLSSKVLELMPNGLAVCRMLFEEGVPCDYIHLYTNPAFHAQTGLGPVCGLRITELESRVAELERTLTAWVSTPRGGPSPRQTAETTPLARATDIAEAMQTRT